MKFTKEQLRVMLIDYESLMRVTQMFSRKVSGDSDINNKLIDDDITRMKILKKLRKSQEPYLTTNGFELVTDQVTKRRGIKCRDCNMTSWNKNDVIKAYCGNCHKFHKMF